MSWTVTALDIWGHGDPVVRPLAAHAMAACAMILSSNHLVVRAHLEIRYITRKNVCSDTAHHCSLWMCPWSVQVHIQRLTSCLGIMIIIWSPEMYDSQHIAYTVQT